MSFNSILPVLPELIVERAEHIIKSSVNSPMGESVEDDIFIPITKIRIIEHSRKNYTLNNETLYFTGTLIFDIKNSRYNGKRLTFRDEFPIKEGSFIKVDNIRRKVVRVRIRKDFAFHHWTLNLE